MHCIVLPCRLITVFWLLCLQVTMAGPHSHFDRPLWKARPCRRTTWVYKLLMQISQLEHSSAWFILCELQKLRFNFRGSIILVFQCIAWKEKQPKWQRKNKKDITPWKVILSIQKCTSLRETKHSHYYKPLFRGLETWTRLLLILMD